jgi:MFS family permease
MSAPAAGEPPVKVGLRLELAVYGAATFSNSLGYMIMVVMPLWVLTLDVAPLMVGIILGARHFLVLVYSIHGGAMMDRLDVRRMMILFGAGAVALPLLFPLAPWVWLVVVLQMLAGYCTAIGWMGAQAIIGQAMRGSAVHTGRMSAIVRIGALIGPPIAGAAWDFGGPWAAFSTLSLWAFGLFICCLALPAPENAADTRPNPRVRDLVPHLSDYLAAFRLLAMPLVAVVMLISVLRITGFSIQASFYAVYLEGQGYTGTAIGVLLAIYSLFGGGSALMVGTLTRYISPIWLMIIVVTGSTIAITVTPLMGNYVLLAIAAAINGGCYGLSQPLVISFTSKIVGRGEQGKVVGLRTTANRFGATFLPVLMGAVVQIFGIAPSFYVTGGVVILAMAAVALWANKLPGGVKT